MKYDHQIYIIDQNHENQCDSLPENAIPGFVVQVVVKKKVRESMWNATREQAEYIASEYHRQYATMQECGW